MNIAIIGAGAIGSIVAARLSKAGKDVVLIARESYVDYLNSNGIAITTSDKKEIIKIKVLSKLDKEYDLVIFTTKTQDLEDAYQQNNELLENSFILTSQNGVQSDSILGVHFDREKMFSSIVMFGATFLSKGHITCNFDGNWIIGRPCGHINEKTYEIADELKSVSNIVVSDDITGMKYLKLFVNFNNCIPALIGKSMQETFSDIDMCKLSVMLLKEGVDIVQKAGIKMVSLPDFPVERIIKMISMPIDQAAGIVNNVLTSLSKEPVYGSILQSIMRNKPSEIDFINGEVVRIAQQIRAEAPLNNNVVDMVHKVEIENKFFKIEDIKKEFSLL